MKENPLLDSMTEALEKLNIEQNIDCHKITIKREVPKYLWLSLLYPGFLWFMITREWGSKGFYALLSFNTLFLYLAFVSFFEGFTTNRIEIGGDDIKIYVPEFTFYPRWRKFVFSLSAIDKVIPITTESTFGTHNFVNVVLKSGAPYNVTYRVALSDTEAKAIADRINNSLNRFLLPPSER